MITKKISNLVYKMLLSHRFLNGSYKNMFSLKSNFVLVVIAFNNKEILEVQYKYLKENLKDPFDYIIADNSNKKETSESILSFCQANNISYIKIPHNLLTGIRASGSHGIALNWCYRNIIKKHKPNFWGFLDHDIFPISETTILKKIKIGIWGAIRTRGEKFWYLWPGFCFFEYEKTKKYIFNFFPYHAGRDGSIFLDTGGSNYNSIYKKIRREKIEEAKTKLINQATEKELVKGEDSSQTFEIIDNSWLHLRQIAWRKESFNKMEQKDSFIDSAKKYLN